MPLKRPQEAILVTKKRYFTRLIGGFILRVDRRSISSYKTIRDMCPVVDKNITAEA